VGRGRLAEGPGLAGPVSWAYVLVGLTVNVTDMIIFAFRARAGVMRTQMLVFDGIALLLPVALGAWLLHRGHKARRAA